MSVSQKAQRRILVRYTPSPGRYVETRLVREGSQGVRFVKDMTDEEFAATVEFLKRQGHKVTVVE